MNYYLDTEFMDNGKTIELISIGIVTQEGREYYAINSEFDAKNANLWVVENVFPHLPMIKTYGGGYKTREQIKQEVIDFVSHDKNPVFIGYYCPYDWVAFCQLFGPMVDLPKGIPWHCRDLKQLMEMLNIKKVPIEKTGTHHALNDAKWIRDAYKYVVDEGLKREDLGSLTFGLMI